MSFVENRGRRKHESGDRGPFTQDKDGYIKPQISFKSPALFSYMDAWTPAERARGFVLGRALSDCIMKEYKKNSLRTLEEVMHECKESLTKKRL